MFLNEKENVIYLVTNPKLSVFNVDFIYKSAFSGLVMK